MSSPGFPRGSWKSGLSLAVGGFALDLLWALGLIMELATHQHLPNVHRADEAESGGLGWVNGQGPCHVPVLLCRVPLL
jgi:hypothetical protein